jgi:hypothetical protein
MGVPPICADTAAQTAVVANFGASISTSPITIPGMGTDIGLRCDRIAERLGINCGECQAEVVCQDA